MIKVTAKMPHDELISLLKNTTPFAASVNNYKSSAPRPNYTSFVSYLDVTVEFDVIDLKSFADLFSRNRNEYNKNEEITC